MTDKSAFLARARAASAHGGASGRRPFAEVPAPPDVVPRSPDAPTGPVDAWAAAFGVLRGHVHRARVADVRDVVALALDGRGPVLVDRESEDLVDEALADERLRWPACGLDAAATAACGVVRATAAVAATGSIVVDSSRAGRLVSLLPPVAVFVVEASTVVALTGDVLRRHGELWPDGPPTNVVFVTGPSRSGDIEMILAVGVHGPGEVHAVLVEDA
jgi:L-lactate dehydrogenase complex protein LldG